MKYLSEALSKSHDRSNFKCGVELLDIYFQKQANQDVKRKLSACFVMVDGEAKKILGYYTLSSTSVPKEQIPMSYSKKLPRSYDFLPAILLGRLAISNDKQKKGLGKLLLIDALRRCLETSIQLGAYSVVVDPIDERAVGFYSKYGFIMLPGSGKMFVPMQTVKQLFD